MHASFAFCHMCARSSQRVNEAVSIKNRCLIDCIAVRDIALRGYFDSAILREKVAEGIRISGRSREMVRVFGHFAFCTSFWAFMNNLLHISRICSRCCLNQIKKFTRKFKKSREPCDYRKTRSIIALRTMLHKTHVRSKEHACTSRVQPSRIRIVLCLSHPDIFVLSARCRHSLREFPIFTPSVISLPAQTGDTRSTHGGHVPPADNRVVRHSVYTTNAHLSDTSPFRDPVRNAPGRLFSGVPARSLALSR